MPYPPDASPVILRAPVQEFRSGYRPHPCLYMSFAWSGKRLVALTGTPANMGCKYGEGNSIACAKKSSYNGKDNMKYPVRKGSAGDAIGEENRV